MSNLSYDFDLDDFGRESKSYKIIPENMFIDLIESYKKSCLKDELNGRYNSLVSYVKKTFGIKIGSCFNDNSEVYRFDIMLSYWHTTKQEAQVGCEEGINGVLADVRRNYQMKDGKELIFVFVDSTYVVTRR